MANKRIKISELPRITFIPNATGTTVTTTSADYLPIAVTDKTNATVKTTMTITTRELMRFVLQQSAPAADGTDIDLSEKLVIGRENYTVEIPDLVVGDLIVTGSSTFDTAVYKNLVVSGNLDVQGGGFTLAGGHGAGGATYSTKLKERKKDGTGAWIPGDNLSYGIMTSRENGVIDGMGFSLATLIGIEPVVDLGSTSSTGLVAGVDTTGKLNFTHIGSQLNTGGSITNDTTKIGNVISVGNAGQLEYGQNGVKVQINAVANAVAETGKNIPIENVNDDMLPVVTHQINSTHAQPITATKMVSHVRYNNTADTLSDTETSIGSSELRRTVFDVPIVLSNRHENGATADQHDLTDNDASATVPAQVGEIRWNIFNGVPTLYLAVSAHPNIGTTGVDANAKAWYGVPLFGTLDDTTIPPITAHKYTDDD